MAGVHEGFLHAVLNPLTPPKPYVPIAAASNDGFRVQGGFADSTPVFWGAACREAGGKFDCKLTLAAHRAGTCFMVSVRGVGLEHTPTRRRKEIEKVSE